MTGREDRVGRVGEVVAGLQVIKSAGHENRSGQDGRNRTVGAMGGELLDAKLCQQQQQYGYASWLSGGWMEMRYCR
jgi:hypothetical protein